MLKPGSKKWKLHNALKKFGKLSTVGITNYTRSCCPSTLVSHLRQSGVQVKHSHEVVRGRVLHYYELG